MNCLKRNSVSKEEDEPLPQSINKSLWRKKYISDEALSYGVIMTKKYLYIVDGSANGLSWCISLLK